MRIESKVSRIRIVKQWKPNRGGGQISKKESIYILDGAVRTAGAQIVTIPNTYAGDTVELFMAFVSADGNQVSNSIYLGSGTAS